MATPACAAGSTTHISSTAAQGWRPGITGASWGSTKKLCWRLCGLEQAVHLGRAVWELLVDHFCSAARRGRNWPLACTCRLLHFGRSACSYYDAQTKLLDYPGMIEDLEVSNQTGFVWCTTVCSACMLFGARPIVPTCPAHRTHLPTQPRPPAPPDRAHLPTRPSPAVLACAGGTGRRHPGAAHLRPQPHRRGCVAGAVGAAGGGCTPPAVPDCVGRGLPGEPPGQWSCNPQRHTPVARESCAWLHRVCRLLPADCLPPTRKPQGFVQDLEADVEGLRLFAATDLEMLIAQARDCWPCLARDCWSCSVVAVGAEARGILFRARWGAAAGLSPNHLQLHLTHRAVVFEKYGTLWRTRGLPDAPHPRRRRGTGGGGDAA